MIKNPITILKPKKMDYLITDNPFLNKLKDDFIRTI